MSSEVEICNRALSELGTRSTVASLSEASNEARACNINFGGVRDEILRQAPWSFAKAMVNGAVLKSAPGTPENPTAPTTTWNPTTQPPPPWLYTYAYPEDCVAVRKLEGAIGQTGLPAVPIFGTATRYVSPKATARNWTKGVDNIAGNDTAVIWASVAQAIITYTKRVTNTNLWDTLFDSAMTKGLAAAICMQLTGDKVLRRGLAQETFEIILQARVRDAAEDIEVYDPPVDWLLARDDYAGEFASPYIPGYSVS